LAANPRTLLGFAFAAADLLLEIDDADIIREALGAGQTVLGQADGALVGRSWRELVAEADQPLIEALFACLDDGQRRGPAPVRLADADRCAMISARRLPGNGDRISCALSAAPAVRQGRAADGLYERADFESLARSLTEAARATGVELELAMVELAGLAEARAGVAADGPSALDARVAGALRAEAGPLGAATRLAEERFAVLRQKGEPAEVVTRRLARAVNSIAGGELVRCAAQALPLEAASPGRLARALRYALDDFLTEGLKDVPPTSMAEAMNRSVRRTLNRAGELGLAVSQRRFTLAFQPVVRLADGVLHHHEALVRFEEGASPFAMVRMAEEFDLIEELDRAVIEQAVRRLKGDRTGKLRLAVNVSGRSIVSTPFVESLERLLLKDARLPSRIIFEITESAAIDDLDLANRHIQALRRTGALVCLDDFGSGAASLSYLQALTVDVVKIDGRYVRDLAAGGRDAALVRHLVKLCKDLQVRTVAEMVETPQVEEVILAAGVDLAQGWLYGRPADQPEPPLARITASRRTGTTNDWR
jgi:EAL domain-containing protein (putative c-di-GMP-specific phosphodiesterase class I)